MCNRERRRLHNRAGKKRCVGWGEWAKWGRDAAAIARAFKGGGKRIEQRVHQALTTLVRYGEITPLPNGQFVTRQAA